MVCRKKNTTMARQAHLSWPDTVTLYHLPPERELLPDKARRLVFEAFLHLSRLDYTSIAAVNADFMSPAGHSPFLHVTSHGQSMLFCDVESLACCLETQWSGAGREAEGVCKADKEAFCSLLHTKIIPAEEYLTWIEHRNVMEHTTKVHGYGLAWPLNSLVPWIHHMRFCWKHWHLFCRPREELLLDFEQACAALSERLGNKMTFFESGPTMLDAYVFGHLAAVIHTPMPSRELLSIVMRFKNLQQFCLRQLLATTTRPQQSDQPPATTTRPQQSDQPPATTTRPHQSDQLPATTARPQQSDQLPATCTTARPQQSDLN